MGNSLLGSYVSYVKLKGQEKDSEKSGDGRCEIRYELNGPKTPGNKTIAWSFTPNEKNLSVYLPTIGTVLLKIRALGKR